MEEAEAEGEMSGVESKAGKREGGGDGGLWKIAS